MGGIRESSDVLEVELIDSCRAGRHIVSSGCSACLDNRRLQRSVCLCCAIPSFFSPPRRPWPPTPRKSKAKSQDSPASPLLLLSIIFILTSLNPASISQHKSKTATANPTTARYPSYPPPSTSTSWPPRSSTYINPNYKHQPNKYIRPTSTTAPPSVPAAAASARPPLSTSSSSGGVKEVVLNGVAFESSTRSLVRKDREDHLIFLPRVIH